METGRADHCAVVLEELINVIGGSDGQTSLKIVESYDPSTNRWSKVPDMGNAHISAAAVISSGMIFVVGGFCDMNDTDLEPTCEIFDPCLNEWSLVSSLNVSRGACGIVSVDNIVYVFGGMDEDKILKSVECFDVKQNKWTNIDADMPEGTTYVQASLLKLSKKFICSS